MSRIGKQQIIIPEKTEVSINGNTVTVKGPLGELKKNYLPENVEIKVEGNEVKLSPRKSDVFSTSLWGTFASHVKNMIEGVNKPYEKKLILEGVGFKSEVSGNALVLALGFSHTVRVEIPEGLAVKAEKNNITFSGINKELVGQFSAKIRALKKPEPYKGKGFRYHDEVIRRKQGKKSA